MAGGGADLDPKALFRSGDRSLWAAVQPHVPVDEFKRFAQDLEIRRWNHLPADQNFLSLNYGHTDGEIAVDPGFRIENATVQMDAWLLGYIRTFDLLDRAGRLEIRQGWQSGIWSGLLNGNQTSVSRDGLNDTVVRFSVDLIGAPPLKGDEFRKYRAAANTETIIGAALGIQLPTGQYFGDKLINLGTNRLTFRPQLGMHQQYYNWSFELTGAASIFTENTSFFNGDRLQQDPIYSVDGSVEYSFTSGIWASADVGIGVGGLSTVNGVEKDDRRGNIGWSVSVGFPITQGLGVKSTYLGTDHWADVGITSHTFSAGLVGTR